MASTSTGARKRKNEESLAFHEVAPSASTSASTLQEKPRYDVFINHRGPDVKHTLATRIYNVLKDMNVTAFLDSEELEYGDFLPTTLQSAMHSASIHIAIFSENYAKSPWCLAELSFMLTTGAKIVPVFYHVEPTDLRYVEQGKGIYVDAFVQYEKKHRYSPQKLQEWKMALKNVSCYKGQIIKNNDDEMGFLKNIVNIVLKEINNVPLVVANHPVGLEETVIDFEKNALQSSQEGVQIVGIWGMGGSGKTTLAKTLYNKISSSMEKSSFIFDVRDGATKGMLHNKQIQLLKDLGVKEEDRKFDNIEQGMAILAKTLRSVKVLIVLDDVDHADQLYALLPVKDRLGGGSLIIITTREYEVLKSKGISSVYKMRALDPFYSEQLFCWHAFSQSVPLNGFEELTNKFLGACNGLPLSLKVFGAQLYGEFRKEYWESVLDKISRILPDDIREKLKLSYEALDYEEKEMFLDTACFFIGEDNSLAIEVWNGSGWSGMHGWEKLFNKCLVELDKENCIRMHDHLRDLGREIAGQHSPYRFWLPQQIIKPKKGDDIRGIIAVPSAITTWGLDLENGRFYQVMNYYNQDNSLNKAVMDSTNGADWSLTLSSLGPKIFVIRGDYFNKAIYEVSRDLVWLRWSEIGQRNLPSQLSLKNLSVLELYEDYLGRGGNHLKELWETDSDAPVQLRVLVISGCLKFQRFPTSIGRLNLLKKIVIVHGFNLTILPEEFCHLQSLEDLVLHACRQLSSLPTNFGDLRSLRSLDLSCCGKLSMMPDSFKKLMLLQYLNLESCHELILASEDFENITKLEYINLIRCSQLKELPRHLTNQACLRELYLAPSGRFIFMGGKMRLRELPINIGQLSRIQKISIGSELLTTLPTSLGDLSFLTNLQIGRCPNLESLPTSLGDLSSLTTLVIYDCSSLESLPTSLGDLPSLRNLSIVACKDLFSLPASLERLNLLEHLRIDACPINCLPSGLSNLKDIVLKGTQVCRISMSEDRYPRLESLELKENHHLTEIEAVPTTVRSIEMSDCKMLKKLRVPCDLVNLERLQISYCPELEELPSFAHSTSLREFELVYGCYRIQKIKGLENCTRLESLRVETCWEVPGIESLEGMEKLRVVELRASKGSVIERCIQTIEKWPDEISICMPAVPEASSIVDSLPLSPNLVLFHSLQIGPMSTLVKLPPSNGDALMLCCVINSVSSFNTLVPPQGIFFLKEGRWAWVGVYKSQNGNEFIIGTVKNDTCKVEKCLAVRGDKQKVVEAFHSWLPFLRKLGI